VRYAANVGGQFTDLLGRVVEVAVKVVVFLAIMAIGWLVARWLYKWLTRLLRRMGFDRAVERGGLRRMMGNNNASELASKLVVLGFALLVLQLAFGIFGPNPVSDLIHSVVSWLPRLFVAVVIVVIAAAVAGWVKDIIADALGGLSYGRAVATAAQIFLLALGVIAAVNQIGVAVTVTLPILIAVLATIAGVVVVGIGGGLVRPMQHRWERILNRAELDSRPVKDRMREQRAQRAAAAASRAAADRDTNQPTGFDQPAYGGKPTDDKRPDNKHPNDKHPNDKPSDDKRPNDKPPKDKAATDKSADETSAGRSAAERNRRDPPKPPPV
jgi:Conserved TM helix